MFLDESENLYHGYRSFDSNLTSEVNYFLVQKAAYKERKLF